MIIINIIRGLSASSMPWTDLYCNFYDHNPNFEHYDPIVVRGFLGRAKVQELYCYKKNIFKKFKIIPFVNLIFYLVKLIIKNRKKKNMFTHT